MHEIVDWVRSALGDPVPGAAGQQR
jgi:hypothetical protein